MLKIYWRAPHETLCGHAKRCGKYKAFLLDATSLLSPTEALTL